MPSDSRFVARAFVWVSAGSFACALACSGGGGNNSVRVGHENDAPGGGAGSSGSASAGKGAGSTGSAGTGQGPTVKVEDIAGLAIELITVGCVGDCVDVEAVAGGGSPPYAFAWSDGSTSAKRHLCLDASAKLTVTVTDTAINADEFQYEAHSGKTTVDAQVLACSDAGMPDAGTGGTDGTVSLCAQGVTPPFQLIDAAPSLVTTTYAQMNGTLPDYTVDAQAVTVVGKWTKRVEPGTCTKLLLAGDMAGTKPIGFDNFLIIELTVGGAVGKRWYYGPSANIVHTPTAQMLPTPLAPTVPGTSIDPPIPNFVPFGYPALAIDLMADVPAGTKQFELSLYAVDSGGFGSTSAIWIIPK